MLSNMVTNYSLQCTQDPLSITVGSADHKAVLSPSLYLNNIHCSKTSTSLGTLDSISKESIHSIHQVLAVCTDLLPIHTGQTKFDHLC